MGWFILSGLALSTLLAFSLTLGGRAVMFGTSHVTFTDDGGTAQALARRVAGLKIAETVTDEELKSIAAKLRSKAAEGDARAALFVFELARLEREKPGGPQER